MKVPSPVVGRVRPTQQVSNYISVPNATPAAFGAGVGQALAQFGAVLEQRQKTADRFGTMTAFEKFQADVDKELVELQRTAPPDGKGYVKQAEEYYTARAEQFKSENVSLELADEYDFRLEQFKRGVIGRSMDFQYKAGDAFFRQGVNDIYQRSLAALDPATGGDPKFLEAERAKVWAAIDATDLAEIEKAELKRNIARGLEGVTYKQLYKSQIAAGAMRIPDNLGNVIDAAAQRYGQDPQALRTIAWLESTGNPAAKNPNSSAGGLFQFIDDTAAAYGLKNRYDAAEASDAGARLLRDNREGLKKTLGREPSIGELYLAHQQGLAGAKKLLSNPNALAVDVVGYDAVRLNGGAPGMTAGQFAQLWVNKANKANPQGLDTSPAFGNMTYEDRVAAQKDAETEFNREVAAQTQQRKLEVDTQVNALLQGIMDGQRGQKDIDDAYESGLLSDYDTRKKVQDAYDKFSEEQGAAARGAQKLIDPLAVFDPANKDDRDALNALINSGDGLSRLQNGDQEYVANGIVPLVQKAQDIPTDVAGLLTGMSRSRNMSQMLFAMESLRMLQEASPEAFNARIGDDLAKKVDYYRLRKDLYTPEQLMDMVNGGQSQEVRQARAVLESEAKEHLAKKTEGVSKLSEVVAEIAGDFGGWLSSAPRIALPEYARAMDRDYQTFFTDAYVNGLSVEQADEAARTQIKKYWAVTEIGNKNIMKYPPEQMGYKKLSGSYSWIDKQVRAEHGLGPNDQFQLVSDQQTWKEFLNFQKNIPDKDGKVHLPSYQVIIFDENGTPKLSTAGRSYFEPSEEDKAEDTRSFLERDTNTKLLEAEQELRRARYFYGSRGMKVPEEFEQNVQQLKKQKEEVVIPTPSPTWNLGMPNFGGGF